MANPQALKNPVPLGLLQGGATFATVSIALNVNLGTTTPDGNPVAGPYNEIEIQASPSNTGNVYVLVPLASGTYAAGGSPADTTAYSNVIAIIPAGQTWSRYDNASWSNKWNLTDYWLGFSNATDFCVGCAGRF